MFNELHVLPRRHHAQQGGASLHAARGRTRRPAPTRRTATTSGLSPSPDAGGAGATTNTGERTARTARSEGLHPAGRRQPHRRRHDAMGNRVTVEAENVILDPTRPLPERRGRRRTARHPVPGIGDIHCPPQQHRGHGLAPVLQRRARDHRHLLRDAVDVRKARARTHGRGLHGLDGKRRRHRRSPNRNTPLFRRYVEKNRTGVPSDLAAARRAGRPRAAGRAGRHLHLCALRQELPQAHRKQTDGERRQDLLAGCLHLVQRRPSPTMPTCCATKAASGGHGRFIDCKRACKRTLALPGYLDLRHFGTAAEQNGGIRISAAGRNKLKIKADAPGSCVLLLRE